MTQPLYNQIGHSIQTARKEKGLTQADLAQLTKLSRPSIVNIEKGRQTISVHALYTIATSLGTSIAVLLPDAKDLFQKNFTTIPASVKRELTVSEQERVKLKLIELMK